MGDFISKKNSLLNDADILSFLSENSHSIASKSVTKLVLNSSEISDNKENEQDQKIYSSLVRPNTTAKKENPKILEGIFQEIQIISKKEIEIPVKKYYKFPFNKNIVNDGSEAFNIIRNEYFTALSSAYSNYKKFREPFKIQIEENLIVFQDSIKSTTGMSKILKAHDIKIDQTKDHIIIDKNEVSMLYDMLLNYEVPKNSVIPFIISEFEFENGIISHTKISKGPVVKIGKNMEYFYKIVGIVCTCDFIQLKDIKIQIKK